MTTSDLDLLQKWAADNYAKSKGFPLVVKLIEEFRKSELARVIAVDRVSLLTKLAKAPAKTTESAGELDFRA